MPKRYDGLSFRSPSTVGGGVKEGTAYSFQRKCFYDGNHYFVFYILGTNAVYRSSIDGKTWSAPVIICSEDWGGDVCIWFDGTYVYFTWIEDLPTGDKLHYRRGTTEDGIINWGVDYVVSLLPINEHFGYPTVAPDSNGLPFLSVGWEKVNGGTFVFRCTTGDGSGVWTYTQLSTTGIPFTGCVVPLKDGKMYCVYYKLTEWLYGRLWNGTTWEDEVTISRIGIWAWCRFWSLASFNNIVHLVFQQAAYPFRLIYRKWDGSWGDEEIITPDYGYQRSPCLLVQGELVTVFWMDYNKIYYKIKRGANWQDEVFWINEPQRIWEGAFTVTEMYFQGRAGVLWDYSTVRFCAFRYRINVNVNIQSKGLKGELKAK